jgi:ankyrin repeat protein/Cdc6-like AAA superfamily ATPase
MSNAVLDTISTTAANVAQVNVKFDRERDVKILDWLTPINYGPQQSDYLKRRQPGTGQWLLESREFQAWLNTSKQSLFCPGIPGSGKTILTSIVVDYLTSRFINNPKTGIAYIYCNFKRQNEQKIDDLLASVLKQLAESQSSLPGSVKDLYDQHRAKRTGPLLDEILRALQSVIALYSKVFIVVDALDECQVSDGCRTRFLQELSSIQTKHGTNIFATSRFIPDIVDHFKSNLSLKIRASTDDVARYLDGHIDQLPAVVQQDQQLQEAIKTRISEAVDGMYVFIYVTERVMQMLTICRFLLAQVYLSLLDDKLTLNEIRNAMEAFPKHSQGVGEDQKVQVLADAYKQAMERINRQKPRLKKLAMEVLSWITCAKRQLTTSELRHALATNTGKSELDYGDLVDIRDMVSVCAGLVTVDEESSIIRLVHYTTQQYLEQTQKQWFPDAESAITIACVTYLSFSVFETGSCETDQKFEERLRSNPLYEYAAHNWGYHARKDVTSSQVVIGFLESKAKVEASSQALLAAKRHSSHSNYSQESPRKMTGLHLAGHFGVSKAADTLLRFGRSPNLKDTYSRTPLWYAAQNGHGAVVEKMLAAGADANAAAAGYNGWTALQAAAGGGHLEVVEKLLAVGADANAAAAGYNGRTALQAAAGGGHLEVVEKLLTAGAGINAAAAGYNGQTALQAAAGGGHLEVVEKLLAAGADANAAAAAAGFGGQTALQAAAGGGHLEVVKKLLAVGADANAAAAAEFKGQTALQAAAGGGHLEVVEKLLAAGALR